MGREKKFDFYLFIPIALLLGTGIIALASITPANLPNHLLYTLIGLVFFIFFTFIDIEILLPFSPYIYFFCLLILTLTFFLGSVTRGAVRWIPIGNFTFQPSELIKPFLVLISAWFWSKKQFSFKWLSFFALIYLLPIIFILLQPDLGSALVIFSILAGITFLFPFKPKQAISLFAGFAFPLPLFWFFLKDYQKDRIIHFVNPYSDPLGQGYNLIQSTITVGSGGLWGRGWGRGTQSHLAFLPERYTDFIFASIAEELGLLGALFILTLYLFLFLRILKISSWSTPNRPLYFLSMGLFFYLSFQTIVNLGMNIGLLPITGVTLPLVSYGGSSLLATMISLGMMQNVFRHTNRKETMEIK